MTVKSDIHQLPLGSGARLAGVSSNCTESRTAVISCLLGQAHYAGACMPRAEIMRRKYCMLSYMCCEAGHFPWQSKWRVKGVEPEIVNNLDCAISTVDVLPVPIPDEVNQKVILTTLQFQCGSSHAPGLRIDPYRTYPRIDTQRKMSVAAHQTVAGLTAV